MSYALIESNLGDGRYRVRLDAGENQRKALISANELAMAQITFKMDVARDAVLVAEQQEAESRAAIQQLIEQLVIVQASDPALAELTKTMLSDAKLRYGRLVASHSPIRRQFETLKAAHAEGVKRRIRFATLETTSYRDAWCADYTTEAEGYVATIDIPGDSSLVLLAPGCRPWSGGDGTISTERKSGNIAALDAQKAPLAEEAGEITNTLIPQAVTLEATLVSERNAALAAVQASPTQANNAALTRATARLEAQRATLQQLRGREAVLQKQITSLDFQIATWNARPASDSPNYGDGRSRARELCSPEQAFFNAAIFPGWQKFKPTYRWGTITYIDYESDIANVAPGSATSTAQRLGVNQTSQLNGVSVVYLECNAKSFSVGDNVVVGFSSQRWEEPTIIGYLDNPRPCPPRFLSTEYPDDEYARVPDTVLHAVDAPLDLRTYLMRPGAEPLFFSVSSGQLPFNAKLDSATGELSAFGPSSETEPSLIKVRCEDAFYKEGNRRFDETNEFAVSVGGTYHNVSGVAAGRQFPPQDAPLAGDTIPNGTTQMIVNGGKVVFSSTFYFEFITYTVFSEEFTWRDDNAKIYDNYYIRRTFLGGDAPDNNGFTIAEDVWLATNLGDINGSVGWNTLGSQAFFLAIEGPAKSGTYKFEIAYAPNINAILSTITGQFSITGN